MPVYKFKYLSVSIARVNQPQPSSAATPAQARMCHRAKGGKIPGRSAGGSRHSLGRQYDLPLKIVIFHFLTKGNG